MGRGHLRVLFSIGDDMFEAGKDQPDQYLLYKVDRSTIPNSEARRAFGRALRVVLDTSLGIVADGTIRQGSHGGWFKPEGTRRGDDGRTSSKFLVSDGED
jgi:hypothetical protein